MLGGYISPTADAYGKPGLLPAAHRLRMAELALADAPWLAVDRWEAQHPRFVRTHDVVARLRAAAETAGWPNAQVFLVCGADLVQAMTDERCWPRDSVETLFERTHLIWARRGALGGDPFEKGGRLARFRGSVVEMKGFTWSVSSTAVRYAVHCASRFAYAPRHDRECRHTAKPHARVTRRVSFSHGGARLPTC